MKLVYLVQVMILLFNNSNTTEVSKNEETDNNSEDSVDIFSKCYEELGCVQADSRWYHKIYRPVNLRPVERHIIKTDFLLLKRSKLDPENMLYNSFIAKHGSIKAAGFNNDSEVMILVHDFTANGYTGWVKHIGNIIFGHSLDYNLISVDWQRGAEPPYDQAIANARVVALEIVSLLKELKENMHYDFHNVHIIGHGVGAHIAGYVGSTYNKIKKITGLDPSGFRFQGMSDVVKLNPSCAQYVEVIHTDSYDSRSQGINETLGHSDFYVNSAKHQPGCPENATFSDILSVGRNSLHEGEILPGCSHKRSFKYFIEAISNENCSFMGIKCESESEFEEGKCTSCNNTNIDCRIFGLKTYRNSIQRTKFFLNTADHGPFCMFQYKISIFIKDNANGYFDFILIDENSNVAEAVMSSFSKESNYRELKGGQNNTFVYYARPPQLGRVKEAKVRWNQKKKFYCMIFCENTVSVERIVMKFLSPKTEDSNEISLCPPNGSIEIEDGSYRTITDCSPKSTTLISATTLSTRPVTKKPKPTMKKKKTSSGH